MGVSGWMHLGDARPGFLKSGGDYEIGTEIEIEIEIELCA